MSYHENISDNVEFLYTKIIYTASGKTYPTESIHIQLWAWIHIREVTLFTGVGGGDIVRPSSKILPGPREINYV